MSRGNETSLKEALAAMLEHYRLKRPYTQVRLRNLWRELMGPTVMQYTSDIKLIKNKLYVNITSASLRQELSMGREKLRRLLNERLGEEYLVEVIIR